MRTPALIAACIAASMSVAVAPAGAQEAPVGNSGCELHFWGSDQAVTSTYSGVGGLIGGLLSGPRPQSEKGLTSDLPPQAQAEALKEIDLARVLRMPDLSLIVEDGPPPLKPGRKSGRLTSSTSACYAELVVDFIGYSSHITAGRKFGARFWLRRYPSGAPLAQVQNGGKNVQLKVYPAKKAEDHPAALAELRNAFGRAVEGFLQNKVK